MSARRGVLVTVLVAAVIVVAAVGVSVGGSTEPTEPPRFEEFNTSETVSEPLARSGTVDPAVTEESVVLIDDSNSNRFSRADIQPLATGVGRAGAEVGSSACSSRSVRVNSRGSALGLTSSSTHSTCMTKPRMTAPISRSSPRRRRMRRCRPQTQLRSTRTQAWRLASPRRCNPPETASRFW